MTEQTRAFDAVVAGAGPAGLTAAILLAGAGVKTALVSHPSVQPDARTVALMQPAIRLLGHIGAWPKPFAGHAQPLRKLVLVDDTGDFFSAPRTAFAADELGIDAFGWNIPLEWLRVELTRLARSRGVALFLANITGLVVSGDVASLSLKGVPPVAARIVLAADGRDSAIRHAVRIESNEWDYDQSAIATSFAHSVPHEDTSIEYLRPGGPLTTIPMPGLRSSLVWMDRPSRVRELMAMHESDFARELQAAIHGELGLISAVGPRSAFPMRGLMAPELGGRRVMLIGEAGHVMPPIGAQGLNISLTDAAVAAELIIEAKLLGKDLGSDELIRSYRDMRAPDISIRQTVVHNLNRSLLADFLPLSLARAAGSALMAQIAPFRRLVMQKGIEPYSRPPRAMRK